MGRLKAHTSPQHCVALARGHLSTIHGPQQVSCLNPTPNPLTESQGKGRVTWLQKLVPVSQCTKISDRIATPHAWVSPRRFLPVFP